VIGCCVGKSGNLFVNYFIPVISLGMEIHLELVELDEGKIKWKPEVPL